MPFSYRPDILAQLLDHGVRPTPATRPLVVFAYLNALYRYELRGLRDRVRRRALPQRALAEKVVDLRRRYPLVSVHPSEWTEPGTPGESPDLPLC